MGWRRYRWQGFWRAPVVVRSYYRWEGVTSWVTVMMRNRTRPRPGWTPESVRLHLDEFLKKAGAYRVVKDERADGGLMELQLKLPYPVDSDWTASSIRIDGLEHSFRLLIREQSWLALGAVDKFDIAIHARNVDAAAIDLFINPTASP